MGDPKPTTAEQLHGDTALRARLAAVVADWRAAQATREHAAAFGPSRHAAQQTEYARALDSAATTIERLLEEPACRDEPATDPGDPHGLGAQWWRSSPGHVSTTEKWDHVSGASIWLRSDGQWQWHRADCSGECSGSALTPIGAAVLALGDSEPGLTLVAATAWEYATTLGQAQWGGGYAEAPRPPASSHPGDDRLVLVWSWRRVQQRLESEAGHR